MFEFHDRSVWLLTPILSGTCRLGHAGWDMQAGTCRPGHAGRDMQAGVCGSPEACENLLRPRGKKPGASAGSRCMPCYQAFQTDQNTLWKPTSKAT